VWRVLADDGTEVQLPVRSNAYVNNGLFEHVRLPELGVYLVYADRRNLLPKLKALLDFLVDSFGGEADWDHGLEL
jgi:DNA-binding transcriptional LysR family regulator